MNDYQLASAENDTHKIEIHADLDASSPREDDNVGTFLVWSNRLISPDANPYGDREAFMMEWFGSFDSGVDCYMTLCETCDRLEYLRGEIRAERISYGEIAELQGMADKIDPGDVELLEWAGVPEFPAERKDYEITIPVVFDAENEAEALDMAEEWLETHSAQYVLNSATVKELEDVSDWDRTR